MTNEGISEGSDAMAAGEAGNSRADRAVRDQLCAGYLERDYQMSEFKKEYESSIKVRETRKQQFGIHHVFSSDLSDEDMIRQIPLAAEKLLTDLFQGCKECGVKPDVESLVIIYRHTDMYDGPLGTEYRNEDGSISFARATLAAKIGVIED